MALSTADGTITLPNKTLGFVTYTGNVRTLDTPYIDADGKNAYVFGDSVIDLTLRGWMKETCTGNVVYTGYWHVPQSPTISSVKTSNSDLTYVSLCQTAPNNDTDYVDIEFRPVVLYDTSGKPYMQSSCVQTMRVWCTYLAKIDSSCSSSSSYATISIVYTLSTNLQWATFIYTVYFYDSSGNVLDTINVTEKVTQQSSTSIISTKSNQVTSTKATTANTAYVSVKADTSIQVYVKKSTSYEQQTGNCTVSTAYDSNIRNVYQHNQNTCQMVASAYSTSDGSDLLI